MYYSDFDKNGSTETVVTIAKNGKYYPFVSLDDLYGQLVSLKKKFPNYRDFAGRSIDEIFDPGILKEAVALEVNELRSGYLKNDNGRFTFVPFGFKIQVAPITSLLEYDFDNDGKTEILAAGNYFGVKPQQGRFDSFSGVLIKNEKEIRSSYEIGLNLIRKPVRHLNIITIDGRHFLLATVNNDKVQVYKLNEYN